MYCRNCGKKIEDGSAVCPHCGEVLRAEGGYWEVKPKKSEKKGFPVVPLIALLVFAAISIVIFLILGPEFDHSDSKPYGGAKVKKQTVWDNDLLTVTAEGLDRASGEYYYCDALGLTIRNKSGQPISVRCGSMTVNGAAVQPVLRTEIPAGDTVKTELVMDHFSRDDMRIRTIAAITMELEASPAGSTDVVRSGILSVETTKKGKGEVPGFKYEAQPLYEANGIRVGTEGFRTIGTTMAYGVCFHVENGSGETIRVEVRDVVLNDLPHGEPAAASFQPGTAGVFYVRADFSALEKIDKERDFFPVRTVTGTCSIFSGADGRKIASFPFEFKK